MTDASGGRDGSPPVAALAVQVNGLRRDVEALAVQVDVLTRTQEEHAVALEGITELRSQVEKILALVSQDDNASPSGWFWLTMDEQAREEKFGELFDWVETVLRTQYPDYLADQIRPCWAHPPGSPLGAGLAISALVRGLPRQATGVEGCRGLARPLVARCDPTPRSRHEPLRRNVPARPRHQAVGDR